MIKKLDESTDKVVGYKLIGDITKEDFETLVPEVQALVEREESVSVLLEMTEFKREKAEAWGTDLKFGHEFRKNIAKMAIVGDKKWEGWVAAVAAPFFAHEASYYHSDDIENAWAWLRE